jgi:hypothetical protein
LKLVAAPRLTFGTWIKPVLSAVVAAAAASASLGFLTAAPASAASPASPAQASPGSTSSAAPTAATLPPNIDWLVGSGAISLLDSYVGNSLLSTNAFDNPNTFVTGHPREHWTSSTTASFTAYGPPSSPGSFEYALSHGLLPKSTTYVLYDDEDWSLTPLAEQQNPELYMTEFVQLATDYGYKAILAPAIDLTNAMPCYKPGDPDWANYLYDCNIPELAADAGPSIYEVQAQRLESNTSTQTNCDCYTWFADTAESLAASVSVNVSVFAGISSNHSGVMATGAQLATDVLDTVDHVSGYWLNIPVQSVACPSCALTGDPGSAADLLWDLGFVGVGYQTVVFTPPTPGAVGGSEPLTATGGGSLNAVQFSVDPTSTPGSCSIGAGGTTVVFTGAGNCVIDGNEAASTNYLAAPQTSETIGVGPGAQAIGFAPPAADVVGDQAILTASGGSSGNPVVFAVDPSSSPGACSLAGDGVTLSYTGAGSCIIDANQSGSTNYLAAPQVVGTVLVGPRSQTISFTPPSSAPAGTSASLSGTGGSSGNPVTFSLDPSSGVGVCNVGGPNGSTVQFTAVGSCIIDASQAPAGKSFLAAQSVAQTIAVVPGSQALSFAPPSGGVVGTSALLAATGGNSTQPVVFAVDPSSGAGVCGLSGPGGDTVTYTGVGQCVVDATQQGDSNYLAATPVVGAIPVGQGPQTINFSPPTGAADGNTAQLQATGGGSQNPVVVTVDASSGAGVCNVSGPNGDTVSYTGIGNCVVDLNQAGNANYLPASPVVATITVGGYAQSLSFSPPTSGLFGGSAVLSAAAGASGQPVVFTVDSSSTPGACSLGTDGVTVGYTGVGNCVVDASEAGSGTYAPAEAAATITVAAAPQAVTAAAPPNGQVGQTYPLSGTGGASGNPVGFSVDPTSGPGACNVTGTTGAQSVAYLAAGSCVLDASQAASADYLAGTATLPAAAVAPGGQQIVFGQTPSGVVGTAAVLQAASGSASGIPILFSVDPPSAGACALAPDGVTLEFTGVGSCVVDANEPGNVNYVAAAQVTELISVGPGQQNLTVAAPQSAAAGTSGVLTASGGLSSSPILFTLDPSSTAGACSLSGVNGSTVTFRAVGSCVVDANKAGDPNYQAAAIVVSTIAVTQGSQSITFVAPATGSVGSTSVMVASDTGGGSQPIVFSVDPSSTPGACALAQDGVTLGYTGTGNCVVDANQAADANYAAAPAVVAHIAVGPGSQVLSFAPQLTGRVGESQTLAATTTAASGIPIVFSVDPSSKPGACALSPDGVTLKFTGTGNCVVDAGEAADASYTAAATVTATIAVSPGLQAISFAPPTGGIPGTIATLNATSSGASGIPIVFSVDPSTAPGVCSVGGQNGALVAYAGVGQCTIDASQAGNVNYYAAPTVVGTIAVALGTQQITGFSASPSGAVVGGTATISATGGATVNPVTFSIDPSTAAGTCTVSGNLVTYTGAGACVVDAGEAGNADYLAGSAVETISVAPAAQVITFPAPPAVIGDVETLGAITNSNGPVLYSLDPASGAGVCNLSGVDNSTVAYTALGTCVIDANAPASANYLPALQVTVTIHVKIGQQFITFPPPPPATVGSTATLGATSNGGSGYPIIYSVDPATYPYDVCDLSGPDGSTITYYDLGTCVIDANQAGNANYRAAPTMWVVIEVGQGIQTITYTTQPSSPRYKGTYLVDATGGDSGNPIVITTATPSVCTPNGVGISFVGVGKCTIDANQSGDYLYLAAPQAQQSFTVAQAPQTVTFTSKPPSSALYGGSYAISVSGGASGNAVTVTPATPSVCSLAGLTLTFVGVGTCTINASEAGNTYYLPGQASQSFTVGPASQKIVISSVPGTYGGNETLGTVRGASGNPVVFTIDAGSGAGVCTLDASNSSTVDFMGVGSCVVDANEAGNADYHPAPQVQVTIAVRPAPQSITFTAPSSAAFGTSLALTASATSGLPVSFKVDAATVGDVCAVPSGPSAELRFTGVGKCVVDANQTGSADYNAASQIQETITVTKASQAISFAALQPGTYGQSETLAATGGGSGNPVVFSIASSSGLHVCTVTGDTLTFTGAGTCVVNANEAGNADYYGAPVVQHTVRVAKAAQMVTVTSTPPVHATFHGATYAVTATVTAVEGGSGNPVTVSAVSKTVCSASGSTVSFIGVGTCTLTVSVAGAANYYAGSATQKFLVYKATQTVTFTSVPPANALVGQQYTISATGGGSGLPLTFSTFSSSVCSVSNPTGSSATVTLLQAGTCVVGASEAGNADYLAASVSQKFKVVKAAPRAMTRDSSASTLASASREPLV